MDLDAMIDALNWIDLEDQIAYLQMLNHDYQEFSNDDLTEIVDALDDIQTLSQADEISDLFGDRVQITFSKKISIQIMD
ncbi:hypothetical protein PC129_g14822 [Phytophthora cactorum]|nr:hypothetical protein Pcac1_g28558 [Phytophthora cactorum]KAG2809470.1 hypothetical protein PC112_g16499 [Phytophthora cactorum]KAG2811099.1 hypothetical protein PC111_g15378 [Phytophthora cactorum]KAG2850738.1 hypothetical protein PC113_g16505 [Phytophthora cactorum]KAG2901267.1 hypothetical protein PC115_g15933 [Phytophthora cactorum]